ncbi:unnamed protein product [Urochloa humidicola]
MEESGIGAPALPALPAEVLTEIFARLPAKSVGRFRCGSHAWCATLKSPYFVELHYRRANRPGHPRLLLTPVGSTYDGHLYSWRPGSPVEKLMPDNFPDGAAVPLTKPCHGLILIRCAHSGGYFVFNPSTGAILPLPDSKAPLKMIFRSKPFQPHDPPLFLNVSYGLGYCTVRKEYKVVRLFSNPVGGDDMMPTSCNCEVFVLDKPAYWRPSAEQPPLCSVKEKDPAVFIHGHLHFICSDSVITTFNISDETFGSLSPPSGFKNLASMLTELDGCLCICYGDPNGDDPYHVCVLRDYNEAQWETLCCIDRTAWLESEHMLFKSLWVAPLSMYYSNSGQKIMFTTGACKVFSLDPDGSAPQILLNPEETIIGSCEDDNLPALGLYEENLLPLARTIEDMVFSSPTTTAWSDILKWLPVCSVLELSLVCREWRAMIMTDRFIQSHVIHANLNKSPRIMFIMDPRFGWYMDLEEWTDGYRPHLFSDLVCSQPCHGLNVGSCAFWDFICNPVVGYCEHISFDDNDGTFFAGRIGLGYDSEINKHVVVHITYKEKNLETRNYELQCRRRFVNDEQWSLIDPPPKPVAEIPSTFVNGKIYWMVEPNLGPLSGTCEVMSFDVKSDAFEVLQGPPCKHDCGRLTILELQGALCMACSDGSMNSIDIWMLKNHSIWLIEYHIELGEFSPDYLPENTIPLAVDPNDGRILLHGGWSLGYYDPNVAAIETLYHEDVPDHDMKFFPIVCHESLVCPLGLS